jgi:hypothetical protein
MRRTRVLSGKATDGKCLRAQAGSFFHSFSPFLSEVLSPRSFQCLKQHRPSTSPILHTQYYLLMVYTISLASLAPLSESESHSVDQTSGSQGPLLVAPGRPLG